VAGPVPGRAGAGPGVVGGACRRDATPPAARWARAADMTRSSVFPEYDISVS